MGLFRHSINSFWVTPHMDRDPRSDFTNHCQYFSNSFYVHLCPTAHLDVFHPTRFLGVFVKLYPPLQRLWIASGMVQIAQHSLPTRSFRTRWKDPHLAALHLHKNINMTRSARIEFKRGANEIQKSKWRYTRNFRITFKQQVRKCRFEWQGTSNRVIKGGKLDSKIKIFSLFSVSSYQTS